MQYEIDLIEAITPKRRTVRVFAADRESALAAALATNTGFEGNILVELDEAGNPVDEHTCHGRCEMCSKLLWAGDGYIETDDGRFCEGCFWPEDSAPAQPGGAASPEA